MLCFSHCTSASQGSVLSFFLPRATTANQTNDGDMFVCLRLCEYCILHSAFCILYRCSRIWNTHNAIVHVCVCVLEPCKRLTGHGYLYCSCRYPVLCRTFCNSTAQHSTAQWRIVFHKGQENKGRLVGYELEKTPSCCLALFISCSLRSSPCCMTRMFASHLWLFEGLQRGLKNCVVCVCICVMGLQCILHGSLLF